MITRQFVENERAFTFRSGHIYEFNYTKFQHDPKPLILNLYGIRGQHPKTGHSHQYLLAINLSYINRNNRRHFVKTWVENLIRTNGNVRVTYGKATKQFPYMIAATRKYLLERNVIVNMKEIPLEEIGEAVVGTMYKDFSKAAILEMVKNWKGESNATKLRALNYVMGENYGGKLPDLGSQFFGKILGIAKEVAFGGKI